MADLITLAPDSDPYTVAGLATIPDPEKFARDQKIAEQDRQMRLSSDWEGMTLGDETAFRKVAESRGWLGGYESAQALVGGEELRKKLAVDSFVQDLTGVGPEQTEAARLSLAKLRYGLDDPSEEAFYSAMTADITQQKHQRETAERIYQMVAKGTLEGRPWSDITQDAIKTAGGDLSPYQEAFNQARGNVYAELTPQDIQDVNKLWGVVAGLDNAEAQNTAGGNLQAAFRNYETKTPEQRQKILNGIAMRAAAEGQDVQSTFDRITQAMLSGGIGAVSGLNTAVNRKEAEDLRAFMETGTAPRDGGWMTPENALTIQRGRYESQRLNPLSLEVAPPQPERALTDKERDQISQRSSELMGAARFLQDIRNNGIKAVRYQSEKSQGGWFFGGTLTDATVMLAESLPSMAITAIPYVGPAMMTVSYQQQELARLENQFPDADKTTLQNQSLAVGAWMAGMDLVQNKLLASRIPKLNATFLKYGKPGGLALATGRAFATGVGETAQEVGQDLASPMVQEITAALSDDIKGPDWDKWVTQEIDALGDIFRVSMLMGIIGGAGSTITDYTDGNRLKDILTDRSALALAGIGGDQATEIVKLAGTNPAAAAQLAQDAMINTPAEQRRKVATDEYRRQEVETANTTLREAGLPEMMMGDDGKVTVRFNDGVTADKLYDTPEQAKAEMDGRISAQGMDLGRFNRELIAELEGSYKRAIGNVEVRQESVQSRSLEEAVRLNETTIESARQRARIYIRNATNQMGIDPSDDAQVDSVLGRLIINGASRNEYANGLTTMVLSIRDGAKPTVVFEEAIEAVGKWMLSPNGGKVEASRMLGWLRDTEANTRTELISPDFDTLNGDQQFVELIEAWSRVGVAHATGRIQDSQLSQAIKDFFRAIRQFIADVLQLSEKVRQYSESGKMDPEFRYWLDVAAGLDTEGEIQRQREAAIADIDGQIGETFSVEADTFSVDPINAALDQFKGNPEQFVKVANAAKVAVADVRRRWTEKAINSDLRQRDFDQFRDLSKLEAIARVLPRDIRGVLTSGFRQVAELRTTEARERYIASLLPKVEQALEASLQKTLRSEIKKTLKKGAVKVSEAKTRGGKIGGVAHAIFDEAKRAMKLTDNDKQSALQQADEMAEKLRDQMEGNVTDEQLEELDGRVAAIELFADYANADSSRLTEALNLLKGVYATGRAERLEILKARKEQRQQRVQTVLRGLDREGPLTDAQRTSAKRKFGKFWSRADEGILQAGLSGSQKIRRISEATDDHATKAISEEVEFAALEAELAEQDANESDQVAFVAAAKSIFGTRTEYGFSKKLRDLSTPVVAPVEKAEGKTSDQTVKVPMKFAQAIADGQATGWDTKSGRVELTDQQIAELRDKLDEMDPEDQDGVRSIEVTQSGNPGNRQTIGEISQLEGLQLWLTMRQPDQFAKLEKMGYDQQTMDQLEAWLKPETKALGLWMVNRIGEEAYTIDQLHRSEKGVGLRLVENYFPVLNDVSGADNTGLSIDGPVQHTGKSIGSLKERVKNNAPPAYVNAVAVFLANRAQVNFWKSHVSFLREWGGVVRDERFAAAVKNRLGETYYRALQTTFKRIEGGGALNAAALMDWEKVVRKMTSNFALATLGGRVSTLAINTTAATNALLEIPGNELLKGLGDLINRPEAFKDAFNSPAIQRRFKTGGSYEAQLARSQGLTTNPFVGQLSAWAQIPVGWITKVDTGSQIIGSAIAWEYTRKQSLESGMTEEMARAEADKKVERIFLRAAQPTTRLAKSELELKAAQNPLAALFTLFTSEPRKNIAIAYLAARELITGKGNYGRAMAAQQLFTVMLVQTSAAFLIRSLYQALAGAKDNEDEDFIDRFVKRMDPKAFLYSLSTEHLKMAPIFGEVYNSAMAGIFDQPSFDSSPNPFNRLTQKGWGFATKLGDDKEMTSEQAIDGSIDLVQSVGSILPGGQLFAQSANLAEFVEGVLSSNFQETLSDEDRIRRIKARYSKVESEYTKENGKIKDQDGKIDKAKQEARNAVLADQLKRELLPLSEELRKKALEEIGASKAVIEKAGMKKP